MQAPELLLANLRLLSEQLQAAGHQIEALPVLQLARLVALVSLGSEVSSTVGCLLGPSELLAEAWVPAAMLAVFTLTVISRVGVSARSCVRGSQPLVFLQWYVLHVCWGCEPAPPL